MVVVRAVICFALIFAIIACSDVSSREPDWKPEHGYVPDSETASEIATIVWKRIYGPNVMDTKPFKVTLKDSSVWIIEGSLQSGKLGGTPYAEIRKSDGAILKISHSK